MKSHLSAFRTLRIAFAFISANLAALAAPAADTIKIGAVLPLTGKNAAWGEQGRWGIAYAVNEANQNGGIKGRQVEVVYEDSVSTPRTAIEAATKLAKVDRVPAIIGDILSDTTLAMAPVVEESGTVLIAISASAPKITTAGKFTYRVWPSDNLEGAAAADWAISKRFRKVAILHIHNPYGEGLANVFKARFEAKGGAVVVTQSYQGDQTDFRSNLTRLKSAAPDAVYLVSYNKDAGLILRQASELALKTQFLGATALEGDDLLKIAGPAAEGIAYPTIVDFDSDRPTPAQQEFIKNFAKQNGKNPDWASTHAYDAAAVILEALRQGANSGKDIQSIIDKQRKFKGVTGTITFDENGDVIDKPVVMKTVRDGKFVQMP